MTRPVRLLARRDVERLLDMRECIDVVEDAFRMNAEGKSIPPGILGMRVERGGFHIKAAIRGGDAGQHAYFAAKINANFPDNPTAHAVVADPSRGRRRAEEVVIFDSTGVAFQDVVSAALVYEAAVREGAGSSVAFAFCANGT